MLHRHDIGAYNSCARAPCDVLSIHRLPTEHSTVALHRFARRACACGGLSTLHRPNTGAISSCTPAHSGV
jgi:hypothetical protein